MKYSNEVHLTLLVVGSANKKLGWNGEKLYANYRWQQQQNKDNGNVSIQSDFYISTIFVQLPSVFNVNLSLTLLNARFRLKVADRKTLPSTTWRRVHLFASPPPLPISLPARSLARSPPTTSLTAQLSSTDAQQQAPPITSLFSLSRYFNNHFFSSSFTDDELVSLLALEMRTFLCP